MPGGGPIKPFTVQGIIVSHNSVNKRNFLIQVCISVRIQPKLIQISVSRFETQ